MHASNGVASAQKRTATLEPASCSGASSPRASIVAIIFKEILKTTYAHNVKRVKTSQVCALSNLSRLTQEKTLGRPSPGCTDAVLALYNVNSRRTASTSFHRQVRGSFFNVRQEIWHCHLWQITKKKKLLNKMYRNS